MPTKARSAARPEKALSTDARNRGCDRLRATSWSIGAIAASGSSGSTSRTAARSGATTAVGSAVARRTSHAERAGNCKYDRYISACAGDEGPRCRTSATTPTTVRLLTFDLQPRAERGAVGPVALRQRFGHDDHRRPIGAVVRRQSPALDDAHAHHLKEVRAHDSEPGLRLVGRRARRRASDDVEREVRVHPAERQRRGQGGGGDARYRGAAFEQPSQQAPRRLFAAVGSARRRDRGGEEPFVTEAEIDVLQRDEALDQERARPRRASSRA